MTRRVVIVGGGFTGASAAVQLVRASAAPIDVRIVEPNALGRGLAYATEDPEHRLNAPIFVHGLLPDDLWHFTRWYEAGQCLLDDPQALWSDGVVYARRSDFARYIAETLRAHAQWPRTGSTLRWLRDRAVAVDEPSAASGHAGRVVSAASGHAGRVVRTAGGDVLHADLVILATGNPPPRLPAALAGASRAIVDPLAPGALTHIANGAALLVLGSGLTALDALSTLLAQGHAGPITVLSRHGLRPRAQAPLPESQAALLHGSGSAAPGTERPGAALMLQRLAGVIPGFVDPAAGVAPSARAWLHALRGETRRAARQGQPWQQPFDALRDGLWRLWPMLPAPEQRRVLRQLRPWYDAHRFRSPPQNAALVHAAEQRGQVVFRRGRVRQVSPGAGGDAVRVDWVQGDRAHYASFDALVNCTGLDTAAGLAANPLLSGLLAAGRLTPDACGLGVAVDDHCRAIDAAGRADGGLRVFGPPTLGRFGDPIGAFFIAAQIHRALPDLLVHLRASPHGAAAHPP